MVFKNKSAIILSTCAALNAANVYSDTLIGTVNNLSDNDIKFAKVYISESKKKNLKSKKIKPNGTFAFKVSKNKSYLIRVEASGYKQESTVHFTNGKYTVPSVGDKHQLTIDMAKVEGFADNVYRYHWSKPNPEEDALEYSSKLVDQSNKTIIGDYLTSKKDVYIAASDAAKNSLFNTYNIKLDSGKWTKAHAERILYTMKRIVPAHCYDDLKKCNIKTPKLIFKLVSGHLKNDVEFSQRENKTIVRLSDQVFKLPGMNAPYEFHKGDVLKEFYSKRLHHALTYVMTDKGHNKKFIKEIFYHRFGVTIDAGMNKPSSDMHQAYQDVPNYSEDRTHTAWQPFKAEELLILLEQFEELPDALKIIHQPATKSGLYYLFRRLNGHVNKHYPQATAIAHSNGYIEFMESAFRQNTLEETQRTVIHEKAHHMWWFTLTDELREKWRSFSGWNDVVGPNGETVTMPSTSTNFASAYAHTKVEEDFAETVAYYVINPDILKSVALEKYNFIKNEVMGQMSYEQLMRSDLTFNVEGIADLIFPGKINEVDITVKGGLDDDKKVTMTLGLYQHEKCNAESIAGLCFAKHAYARFWSKDNTYKDVYFYPVDKDGNYTRYGESDKLKGEFTIPATAAAGLWAPKQIEILDAAKNARYDSIQSIGAKLWIYNRNQRYKPEYEQGTLKLRIGAKNPEGSNFTQNIIGSWKVSDGENMDDENGCWMRIANENSAVASMEEYGTYDHKTGMCHVQIPTTNYYHSGRYSVRSIRMLDRSLSETMVQFRDEEKQVSIHLDRDHADTEKPVLNIAECTSSQMLNCLKVEAEPLASGETSVTLSMFIKDNLSGFDRASFNLRDPLGKDHFYHADDIRDWDTFTKNKANTYRHYVQKVTLPRGSAVGTWGLSTVSIYDKAHNKSEYDFTETVTFRVKPKN